MIEDCIGAIAGDLCRTESQSRQRRRQRPCLAGGLDHLWRREPPHRGCDIRPGCQLGDQPFRCVAAVVAEGRLRRDEDELSADDVAFYRGKVMAAKHYVNYVLSNVHARVAAMVGGDRSALDIPDAGFAGAS